MELDRDMPTPLVLIPLEDVQDEVLSGSLTCEQYLFLYHEASICDSPSPTCYFALFSSPWSPNALL